MRCIVIEIPHDWEPEDMEHPVAYIANQLGHGETKGDAAGDQIKWSIEEAG